MKKSIAALNDLLGRELGRNPYNTPVYQWDFSEDLFWPSYATGQMVETKSPGGIILLQKEYRRDRMSHKLHHQWVITKWIPADSLPDWNRNFPGADYPAQGYRIHTNMSLERGRIPTLRDTERAIACVKEATSMSFLARMRDMEDEQDRTDRSKQNEMYDEVRDSFTAFLNPCPGKRGGFISFGGVEKETQQEKGANS